MKKHDVEKFGGRSFKLLASLVLCAGLLPVNALAVYRGVQANGGTDQDSGTISAPAGATIDAEIYGGGTGTASMTVSGGGVYISGTVYGNDVDSDLNNSMSYADDVYYDLYASGGNAYAVVSVYW